MIKTSTKSNPWNGKIRERETPTSLVDPEFTDLEPTITYRHVLSNNLGVKDPLRVIALCDSDAFYAACEMVRLNVDKDVPLVVLQWDSLIAVNYPARQYGITRMIKVKDALHKCPHLKVVHVATYKEGDGQPEYWENVDTKTHKVSLDYYRRESVKIATKFRESLPSSVEIEKASIDEAFFDYTKAVKEILLQRFPYLAKVPQDAQDGIDTPLPTPPQIKWSSLAVAHLIPLTAAPSEVVDIEASQKRSGEEAEKREGHDGETRVEEVGNEAMGTTENLDATSTLPKDLTGDLGGQSGEDEQYTTTWHDVALSIAAELMDRARGKVREMGYTTSAGIARNKFLAKLAASYKKPDSQVNTCHHITPGMGAKFLAELKSILRNKAIPSYMRPLPFQKIRFLGGKLGSALAKAYEVSIVGDLLTISLEEMQHKFGEGAIWIYEVLRGIDRSEVKEKSAVNKSMSAAKNLPKPIKSSAEGHHWIRVLAAELALRLSDARQANPNLWPKTIVLHARKGYESGTGYENGRSKQAPFPFVRRATVDIIANAGDKLWKELVGTNATVHVGHISLSFTGIDVAEQGQKSIEGFLKQTSANSPKKRPRDGSMAHLAVDSCSKTIIGIDQDEHQSSDYDLSYSCSRCKKILNLPANLENAGYDVRQRALTNIRLEHQDFHFAEDLMKESEGLSPPVQVTLKETGSKPGPSKKRRKVSQGLDKYFAKK